MGTMFQDASGYSASDIAWLIKGLLAGLITLWAMWSLWGSYKLMARESIDSGEFGSTAARIVFVLVFVLLLVAV